MMFFFMLVLVIVFITVAPTMVINAIVYLNELFIRIWTVLVEHGKRKKKLKL